MRYYELFEGLDSTGVTNEIRGSIVDILTPLASQGVHFVTVQQVLDALQNSGSGIQIDRSMIMQLLNPDSIKLIKSIEGDRINLDNGDNGPTVSKTKKDQQKQEDDIKKSATSQAQKNIDGK
jgi:hypothetical protein